MTEQINTAVDTQINFNPKEVLNIIEKTKNNLNQVQSTHVQSTQADSNIILPNLSQFNSNISTEIFSNKSDILNPIYIEEPAYLNDQYPTNSKIPKYNNSPQVKKQSKKCNDTKCTYKCDSSYSNAISYLDLEFKPVENFGNIYDTYAKF